MELKITHMINGDYPMSYLSGSQMEHGENAGNITWHNSQEYAQKHYLLTTQEEIKIARKFFEEMGCSDIPESTDKDIQALIVQYIAGDIREFESCASMEDYEKQSEAGRLSGRIFQSENDFFFSID